MLVNPLLYALESISPVSGHGDFLIDAKIRNSMAFADIMAGRGDRHSINVLVAVNNITHAFFMMGRGTGYAAICMASKEALTGLMSRFLSTASATLRGPEIVAIQDLMELHNAMLETATVGDVERAQVLAIRATKTRVEACA